MNKTDYVEQTCWNCGHTKKDHDGECECAPGKLICMQDYCTCVEYVGVHSGEW